MRPDWCSQDIWDSAFYHMDDFALVGTDDEPSVRQAIARAIMAEREACAKDARSAVMKFKSRVGGRYYAGYHEDMRDFVAEAIRNRP